MDNAGGKRIPDGRGGNGDSPVFRAADIPVFFREIDQHLVAERLHADEAVVVLFREAEKAGV